MEKKVERKSNIELLRIVAMMLIIAHHFVYYNLNQDQIEFNNLFVPLGAIGNDIFIIISGYFLINKEFKSKKIFKFWLQILFYSIILFLFSVLYFKVEKIDLSSILKTIMPISFDTYWFATVYFFIYLLSPMINKCIKSIKKDYLGRILLILFAITLIPTSLVNYHFLSGIGSFGIMLYMYVVGAYINLYGIKKIEKLNKTCCVSLIIVIYIIMIILIKLCSNTKFENISGYVREIESVFVISISILMLYLFSKINIKNNKIINGIAKSSFATYLIHENPAYRQIFWKKYFIITNNILSNLGTLIIAEIVIFAIAILIETLRKLIFEKLIMNIKYIDKMTEKIDQKLEIEN